MEIDDANMDLLIHSRQFGALDEERVESILQRRASDKAISWIMSLGIANAREPVFVPANPEFANASRVCIAIRYEGNLLGYMWLIDPDHSLTAEQIELAKGSAKAAGRVLYSESLLLQVERGRERELLRDLLSERGDLRKHAADGLINGGHFASGTAVSALVARYVLPLGKSWGDETMLVIGEALEDVRRLIPARRSLCLGRPDHSVFVVGHFDATVEDPDVLSLGQSLYDALAKCLAEDASSNLTVGIGEPQPNLTGALTSYNQANEAARVAKMMPAFGPVVSWRQLGIYGMLSPLMAERLTVDTLHPGLVRLLKTPEEEWLVQTLECYLDSGGDAQCTAKALGIHRTSLYYRLGRIQEIAIVDLHHGEDRLALHLGLKLARLAGIYPLHYR